MDDVEFMRAIAKLTSYFDNKKLSSETVNSYWEILNDLPYKQTIAGIIKTMSTWEQGYMPKPATIRRETLSLSVKPAPLPAEAWAQARHASAQREFNLSVLHPAVQRAIRGMGGLDAMGEDESPLGMRQARFMKLYEPVAGEENQQAVLPEAVRAFSAGVQVKQIG